MQRYSRPYVLPLSRSQIRASLRLGLGRVQLHVANYGLEDVRDELLHACRKNLVYDTQCEPSRVPWIVQMLTPTLESELASSLKQWIAASRRPKDLRQQVELALWLARRGHSEAREALYSALRFSTDGSSLAAREIVELDGLEGLRWVTSVARRRGALSRRPDRLREWVDYYQEKIGTQTARDNLAECPELRPYLPNSEEAKGKGGTTQAQVAAFSFEQILSRIDRTSSPYYVAGLRAWSQAAPSETMQRVVQTLLQEESPHRLVHLLSIVRWRPLSAEACPVGRLLELAEHPEELVRRRANAAMAEIRHPDIRERSLKQLQARRWLESAILPLKSNLEDGDFRIFEKNLRVSRKAWQHHRLIGDLLEICRAQPRPEWLQVMLFLYQTSPCSLCRHEVFELMNQEQLTPEWVAREWPQDAYHETGSR